MLQQKDKLHDSVRDATMQFVRLRVLIATLLLGTAVSAHAEELTMYWSFKNNQMPVQTTTAHLTKVEQTSEGIHVIAQKEGFLIWQDNPIPRHIDVITMKIRSATTFQAGFMWKPKDQHSDSLYRLPFVIRASEIAQDVHINVNYFSNWDWQTKAFGLLIPANSELIIEDVSFRRWSPFEKLIEGWKSFWTFDNYRAYSINFLWGPIIATSGPARAVLYNNLPPYGWFGSHIFYSLLGLALLAGLCIRLVSRNKELALGVIAATFVGIWMMFDVRMGLELMSYAFDDIQTYVLQEGEEQTLRTHGNFYAVINEALPAIRMYDSFTLRSGPNSVYYPHLRYQAYPTKLIPEGEDATGVPLWAIFERREFVVDEEGYLLRIPDRAHPETAERIAGPGKVIMQFDPSSFLYEVR